jgi:hypothetical protein
MELEVYYVSGVARQGFKEECTNLKMWAQKVVARADLADDDCPICYHKYILESELDTDASPPHSIPFKLLACNHIICAPCLKNWANSGSDNSTKCPTCRESLPPSNAHIDKALLLTHGVRCTHDKDEMPQVMAEKVHGLINTYLSTLPTALRDTTPLALPTDVDSSLNCWRINILETPAADVETSILHISIPPGTTEEGYKVSMLTTALQCLRLARKRLEAFMQGDLEGYRKACIEGLHARVHLENLAYFKAIGEFIDEYKDWVEEEEDARRVELGDVGEDEVVELAAELGFAL